MGKTQHQQPKKAGKTTAQLSSESTDDSRSHMEPSSAKDTKKIMLSKTDCQAVVTYRALEQIARTGECSTEVIYEGMKRDGYMWQEPKKRKGGQEEIPITRTFITQQLGRLAGKEDEAKGMRRLGLRQDPQDPHRLSLDPTAGWYVGSNMSQRLNMASEGKERIAQVVARKILELAQARSLWAYFDAGSSCLACARAISEDQLKGWHVLTNNLFLALELIQKDHPFCFLPAGKPDRYTAAIVDSKAEELQAWFKANTPQIAVVSFHWVAISGVDMKEVVFGVDHEKEQASKVEAMLSATEALFIPITREKIIGSAERKYGTVSLKNGKWLDIRTEKNPPELKLKKNPPELKLKAEKVFFCIDAQEGDLDKNENVITLLKGSLTADGILRPKANKSRSPARRGE